MNYLNQTRRNFSLGKVTGVLSITLFLFLSSFFNFLSAQISVSITKVDPSCSGFTNGSATATATGGTAPYTYRWNNNVTGSTLSGIGGGTYSVVATDAIGRTGTANITLNNPLPVSVSINFANICTGGSVTASASGGTGPYTYDWGGGRTGATQTTLAGGSYNLTVTDSKGCSSVKFVSVPGIFSVSMRVGALQCFGDCDAAIDALTTGGTAPFTFRWNTGSTTPAIVGIPSGTYSVTITDANGCTGSATGTVVNPPQIVITTSVVAPACGGGASGSATVSATGGRPPFTYKWSNGQTGTTVTGLSVGDYFVTVMDAGGCNRTAKVVVPSNAGFTIGINSTNATCAATNGSATASVTSGGRAPFTYKWNTNATTASITGIGAGTYTVTVTDANGCVNTASTVVNAAGNLSVIVTGTNAACGIANGTATATPTGTAPFTYKWSNGPTTQTITLLAGGTYTVTVMDASGCTAIGSTTITTSSSLAVTVDGRNITCFGGNDGGATAMVMGGSAPYTYRWSNGGNIAVLANLTAGSYTVTVSDASGCSAVQTIIITQPTAINIATSVNQTTCGSSNGSASAIVTGGTSPYTYAWSNGSSSNSISNLTAGSYTLTVTDSKGCRANATVTVTSSNGISLSMGSSNVICNGGNNGSASATVTGNSGTVTYAWSNGATTASISNLTAGTYSVTATNGGCTATGSVTITQPTAIVIGISLTNPTCGSSNGSLTATASGGTPQYSYKWSNGATTASISGLASGTYTITVTDANGCTKMTSQALTAPNSPVVTISGVTNVTCFGGNNGAATASATGGTAPYTYNWGSGRVTAAVTGLTAGTYTVTVTDATGCSSTQSVTITQPTAITITSTVANATCRPIGSVQASVSGGTSPYSYLWSNGATTATISNLAGGNYTVTVTDSRGCTNFLLVAVPALTSPNLSCQITITKQMTSYNSNDAAARVDGANGLAPYTYAWTNGATTQTISNLAPGPFTVTVTDANGCSSTCFINVPNAACNNVTNAGTICCSQTICSNSELQQISETAPATGGSNVDPIQYLWMYNEETAVFNPTTWRTVPGATGANLPVNLIPTLNKTAYFVRCVRRGICDYLETNVITITLRAFANISGPTVACLNQDVTFTAGENVAGTIYEWSFAGAIPGVTFNRVQTVKFTSTGQKEVRLTVTSFGCQKVQTIMVNVTNCQGAFGGFVGFNANPVQQKEVMLDWATSNEQTASQYLIEKSTDGITFRTIGTVASQNQINNLYRFADTEPKMGRSFYRIHQVSMDNVDVKTTDAKKVLIGQSGQSVLTYPNPVQGSLFVEVLDTDNAEGTIEVYNHIGILVRTQRFTSNQMRYEVNTDDLPSGTYILKIRRSDGDVKSVKISKL